jgi:DNA-binding SARP family transcriptional activator
MLRLLGFLAMAQADPGRAQEFSSLAATIAEEAGLSSPAAIRALDAGAWSANAPSMASSSLLTASAVPARAMDGRRAVEVRCFGAFSVSRYGRPLDLATVKPRARALLHYLALFSGSTVHREVIQEALWPDADQSTASRSLQVGISTLRGLLEPGAGRGASQLIIRDGEGYRLALDEAAFVDVRAFDDAIAEGRFRQARGDLDEAAAAWQRAVDMHRGDLLAEDGPAEWVIERREAYRSRAAEAATALAEIALLRGETDAATRACRSGLTIDRYCDPLWRLLIESCERAGDSGAAARARQEYQLVLANLGVPGRPAPLERGLSVGVG